MGVKVRFTDGIQVISDKAGAVAWSAVQLREKLALPTEAQRHGNPFSTALAEEAAWMSTLLRPGNGARYELRWLRGDEGGPECFLVTRCEARTQEAALTVARELRRVVMAVPRHVAVEPVLTRVGLDHVLEPFEVEPSGGIVGLRRSVVVDHDPNSVRSALSWVDPWPVTGVSSAQELSHGVWMHLLAGLSRSPAPTAVSVLLVPEQIHDSHLAALEKIAHAYSRLAVPPSTGIYGSDRPGDAVAESAAVMVHEMSRRLAAGAVRVQIFVTSSADVSDDLLELVARAVWPGRAGVTALTPVRPDPADASDAIERHAELDDAWWFGHPGPDSVPEEISRARDFLDLDEAVAPFHIPLAPEEAPEILQVIAENVQIGDYNVQGGVGNVTGNSHNIRRNT